MILALAGTILTPGIVAKEHPTPDYTLHLKANDCCRVWSRSRGCIEGMKPYEGGSKHLDVACYPVSIGADWIPSNPEDTVDPGCQIWKIKKRKCLELTDGREDGWNPNPNDPLERSIAAKGTVTMHYNHLFTAAHVAATATKATEVVVETTVTLSPGTTVLPTRYTTIYVTPSANSGFTAVGRSMGRTTPTPESTAAD
ncbi:hypothetical protein LTR97_000024 [Elasticomyces elasticus]|uniref:Uncharacterized protein n=1 Tax=Elasticomyces elasticus TaxID=574655 RepID=A0AAN7WJN3_9PEZI|nr:hypothetical protein LTR97_000024 [Elasticomyces elasticus]